MVGKEAAIAHIHCPECGRRVDIEVIQCPCGYPIEEQVKLRYDKPSERQAWSPETPGGETSQPLPPDLEG